MSNHRRLNMARIALWAAFVVSLPLATSFASVPGAASFLRYAPPVLLVMALLAGLAERIVRRRLGLPARHFGRG
jgi:hypothetical protein